MEQRDLLKEEIEQLGRALGKVVTLVLHLDTPAEVDPAIQRADEVLRERLSLSIEELRSLSKTEFGAYLAERHLTEAQYEKLAEYFFRIGRAQSVKAVGQEYLQRALWLLELADTSSENFSLVRHAKRGEIERLLE